MFLPSFLPTVAASFTQLLRGSGQSRCKSHEVRPSVRQAAFMADYVRPPTRIAVFAVPPAAEF